MNKDQFSAEASSDFALNDIIVEVNTENLMSDSSDDISADDVVYEEAVTDALSVEDSEEDENSAVNESPDNKAQASFFPAGYDPKFAYRSMTGYAEKLHVVCKKAIRSGYVILVVLPLILAVFRKMTDTDKVFFLVVWIICMFFLAAALLFIAFLDHELQVILDEVHANEKFGSLMSFERTAMLNRLHAEHHLHTIWHVHEHHESEVQE